VGILGG
jgi:hypothetical protein